MKERQFYLKSASSYVEVGEFFEKIKFECQDELLNQKVFRCLAKDVFQYLELVEEEISKVLYYLAIACSSLNRSSVWGYDMEKLDTFIPRGDGSNTGVNDYRLSSFALLQLSMICDKELETNVDNFGRICYKNK